MEDSTAYALEVNPETALTFTLTRSSSSDEKNADGTARCVMTLTHPGKSNKNHLAFKVKTTQPRRYLVRPNQGIVAPGTSETVNILLVEKDKQMLLQSFDRLGQSALDHSKDKFLVQSSVVDESFAKAHLEKKAKLSEESVAGSSPEVSKAGKELAESLTAMWNRASSNEEVQIFNKKLQVRHTVASSSNHSVGGGKSGGASVSSYSTTKGGGGGGAQLSDKTSLEDMTPEQMFLEISSLRRKYDELVTFSVNLTAERDILNNTLEQTKRDLNREIAGRSKGAGLSGAGNGSSGAAGGDALAKKSSGRGGMPFLFVLFFVILFFLAGVKLSLMDKVDFLMEAPVLGDFMRMEL